MPKGSNAVGGGMFNSSLSNVLNPNFDDNPFAPPTNAEQQIADVADRFLGGGIGMSGPIDPLTGAPAGSIGPRPSTSNAIARAEIRGLKQACNGAGNYFAQGVCYTGQGAVDKAKQQAATADNPNVPDAVSEKGETWLEEHSDEIDENGNFTGDITAQQADVANAVNQKEIERQQAVEDYTGEDRSDKISQVVDVIENTVATAVDLLGDTTNDSTVETATNVIGTLIGGDEDQETLGDDLQTSSEVLDVIDGYDELTDEQKEAIDNAIVAGANTYMGGLGDLSIVFDGVNAGGSSSSDSANAATDADSNTKDADTANASTDANADASASTDASASASSTNTNQQVDTSVLEGLPDSGAGSSNEEGGQKSSDGTPDNEYAVIDADGNPVLNDDGTEKKVVVWEDAGGSFVVIGESTVINTDDGPYVITNTGDDENEWGTSGVWTATDKDGNTTEYDFENNTVKDIVITEDPNTNQEGTGDQTATKGSGSATSTGTFPPYVPPVITLPGSSGTGIGGLFNVDLESILGTIIVNSILNSGSGSSNAGNVLSSDATPSDDPKPPVDSSSTTFNKLLDTTSNVTNTTISPDTASTADASTTFNNILDTVTDTTQGGKSGNVNNTTTTTTGSGNASSTFNNLLNTVTNATQGGKDGSSNNNGNGGDGNGGDGDLDNGVKNGDGDFPAAGTYAGGYCKTRGPDGGTFVGRFHDGAGGTYEQERFEVACSNVTNTNGNGGGDGTGQGTGDGPGEGTKSQPEPEPEPVQQIASPSISAPSFTADGEINYQNPRMVNIIEPAALGLLSGLGSNSMDASADLLGRLSFGSEQPQQFAQGFNQLQGFDQLQGLSNLSMFDNVLRRNYIG